MLYLGPSGGGKGTLINRILELKPEDTTRISTYTTRAKRPLEDDAGQYRYVTKEEFWALKEKGFFMAPNLVNGQYYACPRIDMQSDEYKGKLLLLDMGITGAKEMLDTYKNAISIYIIPPNKERLRAQLNGRDYTRWDRNIRQIPKAKEVCQWLIINDDVDDSANQIYRVGSILLEHGHDISALDKETLKYLYDRNMHNRANVEFLDSFFGRKHSFSDGPNL